MNTREIPVGELNLAFHHCDYATRCMVCGLRVKRGDLIVTPAEPSLLPLFRQASKRGKWAHPSCCKRVFQDLRNAQRSTSRAGYLRRKKKGSGKRRG
jgi:hypothetical protein